MRSRWTEDDAQAAVERCSRDQIDRDFALRIYSTRLLGAVAELVQHGGGNTSLKTAIADIFGENVAALRVKASGAEMATIDASGFAAVRLDRMQKLRARAALSEREMTRLLRASLLDPEAPNPSVEVLLHAFLPHKFVDHTHASAVLALVDQPDGEALAREVYDGRMGIVPYIAPGFGLAKEAARVFEQKPDVEGLILHKHGIFTFGGSAQE